MKNSFALPLIIGLALGTAFGCNIAGRGDMQNQYVYVTPTGDVISQGRLNPWEVKAAAQGKHKFARRATSDDGL